MDETAPAEKGERLSRAPLTNLEWAEILEQMAGVYPGDPYGTLMRDACELRGTPYDPPELIVTYTPEPPHAD